MLRGEGRLLMAYIRIHTIKGHKYVYKHESYRVGKKVKKRTTYLGPAHAIGPVIRALAKIATNKTLRNGLMKSDAELLAEFAARQRAGVELGQRQDVAKVA